MRYVFTIIVLISALHVNAQSIQFSTENVLSWEPKSFLGDTLYTAEYDEFLQKEVIRAQSDASASGLFFEQKIDLDKTPWLSWTWRIDTFPTANDEKTKEGDDFAARIYIVVKDGWTPLSTKAVSYVWAKNVPENSQWPNPHVGKRAMMLAVQTGHENSGWVTETRNLKEDLKRLFGKEFTKIDAIAIMADSDNSKSSTLSFVANIQLVENEHDVKP